MNWNNKMNEQMVYAGLTDLQPKQVPQWAQAENLERIRPLRELWKLSENNDTRKFQACLERQIELTIIDSSSLSYFKPSRAQKYLDMIRTIIDAKIARVG